MKSDYLFIGTGVAALCLAAYLGISSLRRSRRHYWIVGILWAVFGGGLLVQAFAPNLKIERNRFIVPYQPDSEGVFAPHTIVARERTMQLLSAILTGGAALGLAFCYRTRFIRSIPPRTATLKSGCDDPPDCSQVNSL